MPKLVEGILLVASSEVHVEGQKWVPSKKSWVKRTMLGLSLGEMSNTAVASSVQNVAGVVEHDNVSVGPDHSMPWGPSSLEAARSTGSSWRPSGRHSEKQC